MAGTGDVGAAQGGARSPGGPGAGRADVRAQRTGWWLVATAALAVALQVIGAPLVGPDTPLGIVSLQFVADPVRAAALVAGWGEAGRVLAVRHLLLDLVFPIAYAAAIAAVARGATERWRARGHGALRRVGPMLVRAAAAAAVFDLIENAAMLATLGGRGGAWSSRLTVAMAVPKFALLAAAVTTVAVLLVVPVVAPALRRGRAG